MATVFQPGSTSHYVEPDAYIDYQLQKTRAGVKSNDMLTAGVGVVTMVLGYLLLFVMLDQWVVPGGFSVTARWLMLSVVMGAASAWLTLRLVLPYLKRVNSLYAARLIEENNPELRSTLLNLVDLDEAGRPIAEPVRNTLEKRAAVALSKTDVDQAIDRRPLMRIMYLLLAIVVAGCLYALLTPKKIGPSVVRALLPQAEKPVSTQTEILEVKPGDVEILARAQVEVTAELRGEIPDRVMLFFSTEDRKFVDAPVEMRAVEGSKQYRALLAGENGRGILQDMTYRIEAGDARTPDFRISVQQPPSARVDSVAYEFPAYMEFLPKTEAGGVIDGWEGANVTVSATANVPVRSATILFSDTEDTSQKAEEIRMTVTDGVKLRATWTLGFRADEKRSYAKFYRVHVKTEKGDVDPQPTLHGILIRPDLRPDVALLDPTRDLEKPANAVVPLMISARDDFKLKSVAVRVQKNGEELLFDGTVLDQPQQALLTKPAFEMSLGSLGAKPGDVLTYWIEARDNRSTLKNPEGQVSNTPKLTIKVVEPVAPQEAKRQLEEEKQKQDEKLEELKRQANEEGRRDPEDSARDAAERPPARPQQEPNEEKDPKAENRPKTDERSAPDENSKPREGSEKSAGEQKPADPKAGEKGGEPRQRPKEEKAGDNPQDRQPNSGDSGSESAKDGASGETGGGSKNEKNGRGGRDQKLDPDGKDDGEILEKLLDKERQNAKPGDPQKRPGKPEGDPSATGEKPGTSTSSPEKPSNQSTSKDDGAAPNSNPSDNRKNGASKPDNAETKDSGAAKSESSGEKPSNEKKPGESSSDPAQPKNDGGKPDDRKPTEEKKPGSNSPSETPAAEKPSGEKPGLQKTGSENGGGEKNDPDKNAAGKNNDPAKKEPGNDPSARPMPGEKKPGENTPDDQGKGAEPKNEGKTSKPDKNSPEDAKTDSGDKPKPNSGQTPGKGGGDKTQKNGNTGGKEKGDQDAAGGSDNGKPEGKPSPDAESTGEKSPKDGGSSPSNTNGSKKPNKTEEPLKGEETPAEDSPDARKQKATGKEKGRASSDTDPDADPTKAENPLERKPGEKPVRKPGDDDGKANGAERRPEEGPEKAPNAGRPGDPMSKDPANSDAKKTGRPKNDPEGSQSGEKNAADSKKPAGEKPDARGKPGEGEPEAGSPSKDGVPGQKSESKGGKPSEKGVGEKSASDAGQPGEKNSEEGKPGDSKNRGKSSRKNSDKTNGPKSESGEKADGPSQPGGGQDGAEGKPSEKPNGAAGQGKTGGGGDGSGQTRGGPNDAKGNSGQGAGEGEGAGDSEAANAEDAREAATLVLKKLQDQLKRGDVDPELLKELGWTENEMRRFADRLQKQLGDSGADNSPAAQAQRRQFEETLKNLDMRSGADRRRGADSQKPDADAGIGPRKLPVPAEYREAYEAYTRSLSKRTSAPTAEKPKPASK